MNLPIVLKCQCGREVMATGDAADLIRLVDEKSELVREVEALRAILASEGYRTPERDELLPRRY